MNVKFYKINKKVNSTFQPSAGGTDVNVVLKSPSSIINPRFEFNSYMDVNYCYVQEFNRYYFINDIRYENPLWIYSCSIDVLASFKTEIGANTKYVLRSASSYDLTLKDNSYPTKADFTTFNATLTPAVPFSGGYVVIGVLGNNENTNGISYYQTTPAGYSALLKGLLTSADGEDWGDFSQGVINSVLNPYQYIVSAKWFPSVFADNGQTTIKAGLWDSHINAGILDGTSLQTSNFTSTGMMNIPKHPKASTRGDYLNLPPFTRIYLQSGLFGIIELDATTMLESDTMYFTLYKDFIEGNGRLVIRDSADGTGATISDIKFKYGVDLPIVAKTDSGALGITSGIVGVGLGMATANPMTFLGGARSLVNGALTEANPNLSYNGNLGGYLLHNSPTYLKAIFYDVANEDLTNHGRPLMQMKTINTLNGYLICEEGNIESSATESEKELISNYLTSGFYFE